MTKELMDKYKAGELDNKDYYVEVKYFAKTKSITIMNASTIILAEDDFITDILAPVPSYEEWSDVSENFDDVVNANHQLCEDRNALESENDFLKQKISTMEDKLAEHKNYCCCMENEVLQLKIDKLEKQLEVAKKDLQEIYEESERADYFTKAEITLHNIKELDK